MANRHITRNIALTPRLDRFVQAKVRSGRYQSASEVVRESLRLLEESDAQKAIRANQIRDEIEIGWDQVRRGETVDGPSVFDEMRKMSRARRRTTKRRR